MSPQVLLRLLKQHALWFILLPMITAGIVFYLTRHEPKIYKSQATLYTGLASGYSIGSVQQNSFADRSTVAFDNLLTTLSSTETLRQIGVSLLTRHLQLQKPDGLVLSAPGFTALQQLVPASLRASLLKNQTGDQLYAEIDSLSKTKASNPIKALLFQASTYYSIPAIGKQLKAVKKNTNDMLVLEYEANDPAVAQQTLSYAMETLTKRYILLKTSETNSVVGYYNDQTDQAKQRLDQAEKKLQAFSVTHKVLNFDEESKNVTTSRETVVNEYNQEMMRNKAAKAAMDALAKRMGQFGTQFTASTEMNDKREALTEAQNQLVNAQVYGKDKSAVDKQQAKVNQIQSELKAVAARYNTAMSSSDAIPQQTVVNDWLTKVIDYEESTARLKLYSTRMRDFETKTAEFSPLGSQLRQLNRELATSEKEYDASVDNLNKALTHRRDITIDGALATLDTPNFPLGPEPSKRMLLVAGAIGVGLFLALILAGLRFWLDQRVSSPEKAELTIGKPVAAMFPTVRKFTVESKAGRAAISMFEQLCNAINIEIIHTVAKPHPPIVTLFSIRPRQGKSWITNGLARLYAESGQQIAYFYPRLKDTDQLFEENGVTFVPYSLRPDFMNVLKLEQLLNENEVFTPAYYDKVILELPALISSPIPVYLVDQSYLSVLVTDANSSWGRTEKQLLEMYMRIATHPIITVLNRVGGDYMDTIERGTEKYQLDRAQAFLSNGRNLPTGA